MMKLKLIEPKDDSVKLYRRTVPPQGWTQHAKNTDYICSNAYVDMARDNFLPQEFEEIPEESPYPLKIEVVNLHFGKL